MTRFLGFLFSLLALGAVLAAAAVVAVIWYYGRDLPDHRQLAEYRPDAPSKLYAADGAVLAEFAAERRVYTPIDEIPDIVKQAFISAEDKNFYHHGGIDPEGVAKAMVRNVQALFNGGRMAGASTITQQVVRNSPLLANERTIERKLKEFILAVRLDRDIPKDKILEFYLNEIFLGQNAYGVAAAADKYFGKPLADLSLEQAAYLAALPQAPSVLHPVRRKARATARRDYVLKEMLDNGYIAEAAYEAAVALPLETVLDDAEKSGSGAYDYSAAYVIEETRGRMIEQFGEASLMRGGLTIRSTVDPQLQAIAAAALRFGLGRFDRTQGYRGPVAQIDPGADWRAALAAVKAPRDMGEWRLAVVLGVENDVASMGVEGEAETQTLERKAVGWARRALGGGQFGPAIKSMADVVARGDVIYVAPAVNDDSGKPLGFWGLRQLPEVNGALVAMDPHTGRILAMQGGYSAQQSIFNRATQAKRQPGSSFKPFVYAAALEAGYSPNDIVLDAPVTVDQGAGEDLWRPDNYSGHFYGPTTLRIGLEKSRNLITVRLAQDIGMEKIAEFGDRFGIYDEMPPLLSFALGAGETTLMRMTTAYAALANGGRKVEPTLIDRVQDRDGATLWRAQPCDACVADAAAEGAGPELALGPQLLAPDVDYQIVSMLEGVVLRGTATKLQQLGFPVAGKTGTTNAAKDAWFIGFTPDLVVGCFIGYNDPRSLGSTASGGALCGPVFEYFMRQAMKDKPSRGFTPPPGIELARIHRVTGRRVADESEGPDFIWEAFRAGTAPTLDDAWTPGSDVNYLPPPDAGYQPLPVAGAPQQPYPAQPGYPQPAQVITAPGGGGFDEPLIRIDPVTGAIIIANDAIVSVPAQPGVTVTRAPAGQPVYQPAPAGQPSYAPPAAPTYPPPQPGGGQQGSSDVLGGHGLY